MDRHHTLVLTGVLLIVVIAGCSAPSGTGETSSTTVPAASETTTSATAATPTQTATPTQSATPTRTATATPTPTATPPPAIDLEVEKRATAWDSDRTIEGNVSLLSIPMPQFDYKTRQLWVYVPPNYSDGDHRYPVVYMQDGQNLFDDESSFVGEWGIDESMNRLHDEGELSAIVVGVEHGARRGDEYLPWNTYGTGGDGDRFATFLAETLKPEIDDRFRTRPNETAILGSSYGGVISIYTAFEYPNRFQYVGGMSNAHMGLPIYEFLRDAGPGPKRVYLDWGTNEMDDPQQWIDGNRQLRDTIDSVGYEPGDTLLAVEAEGGEHNEAYWQDRFPRAIQWLLTGEDPVA